MGILFAKSANEEVPDLRVDLENAQPTPEEADTYAYVLNLLRPTSRILQQIREYQGCGESIRQAISSPSPQTEEAAWDAVCPAVDRLREFYEYANALEDAVPRLLEKLGKSNVQQSIETQPALTRLFADILDFVFEFDELKMANPSIQNDFSYYRRTMNRLKSSRNVQRHPVINDELANRMSLFYAYHTPMLKTITDVTSTFVSTKPEGPHVTDCLAAISGVCYHAVSKQRVKQPEAVAFLLRVMVATTVLYDHVHSQGAFVKSSPINIKNIVRVLQIDGDRQSQTLLNALRYSSRHLNDETTPKNIRQLLAT